jgi:hypothetical protein
MAAEAMGQIESRNYAKPYLGLGQAVYKVALVVGWRAEVLVVLEEEKGELKA